MKMPARPIRKFPARLLAFLRDCRGVAAIEMAFIAPVMLLIYFGTVDTANWYMAHRRLVTAGNTMADLTTQNTTTITGADMKKYWDATSLAIALAPTDGIKVTVRDFRIEGSTAKQQWQYSPGGTTATCGANRTTPELQEIRNNEMTDANDIVMVEVCTAMPPIALQVFGYDTLNIQYTIKYRPRLSKTLDCTSGCS